MSRYDDILRRNEQLIDNVYDMHEEITDLANENEDLTKENEVLLDDNEVLLEENIDIKKDIADLHRKSAKRYSKGRRYSSNKEIKRDYINQEIVDNPQGPHRTVSLFISEKFKKTCMFVILGFLILLLGLGIEPGTAINYESILDCYLELVFNLYNICILGVIGVILRKIWKKF